MNVVKEHVKFLVNKEYDAVNETHKPIASMHEGYAVLLEEIEEVCESCEELKRRNAAFWYEIRTNNDKCLKSVIGKMLETSIEAACEAIQVAAVCRRILDRYEEDNNAKT